MQFTFSFLSPCFVKFFPFLYMIYILIFKGKLCMKGKLENVHMVLFNNKIIQLKLYKVVYKSKIHMSGDS